MLNNGFSQLNKVLTKFCGLKPGINVVSDIRLNFEEYCYNRPIALEKIVGVLQKDLKNSSAFDQNFCFQSSTEGRTYYALFHKTNSSSEKEKLIKLFHDTANSSSQYYNNYYSPFLNSSRNDIFELLDEITLFSSDLSVVSVCRSYCEIYNSLQEIKQKFIVILKKCNGEPSCVQYWNKKVDEAQNNITKIEPTMTYCNTTQPLTNSLSSLTVSISPALLGLRSAFDFLLDSYSRCSFGLAKANEVGLASTVSLVYLITNNATFATKNHDYKILVQVLSNLVVNVQR
jgi:hypothetical protein